MQPIEKLSKVKDIKNIPSVLFVLEVGLKLNTGEI